MGMFVDSGIPNDAHTFIGSCMGGPGVSVVAFTPSGGWVVVAPNGSYMAEGIPQDCFTQLGTVLKNGWTVRSIAFPPAGGDSWVIVADQDITRAIYRTIVSSRSGRISRMAGGSRALRFRLRVVIAG